MVEELIGRLDPKLQFTTFGLHSSGLHALSVMSMLFCLL